MCVITAFSFMELNLMVIIVALLDRLTGFHDLEKHYCVVSPEFNALLKAIV